jgi:hypothetical protein
VEVGGGHVLFKREVPVKLPLNLSEQLTALVEEVVAAGSGGHDLFRELARGCGAVAGGLLSELGDALFDVGDVGRDRGEPFQGEGGLQVAGLEFVVAGELL